MQDSGSDPISVIFTQAVHETKKADDDPTEPGHDSTLMDVASVKIADIAVVVEGMKAAEKASYVQLVRPQSDYTVSWILTSNCGKHNAVLERRRNS